MKFTKALAASLLIGAGLMSTSAMAAGPYYAGASLGQSKFDSDACNAVPGIACDDSDTSFKIFGGYSFSPNLSGEIGYLDLGKIKLSNGVVNGSVSGNAVYINAVGNYPLANNFALLGRIGFANATAKATGASESETKLHIGIGASYDFSPTLSLRGEWEQVSDFASSISVGLAVKF